MFKGLTMMWTFSLSSLKRFLHKMMWHLPLPKDWWTSSIKTKQRGYLRLSARCSSESYASREHSWFSFIILHRSTVGIPGKSSYTWTTLVLRIACLLVIRKITFITRCVFKSLYSAAWPGSVWRQRRLNYMGKCLKGGLKSHTILHVCFF